MKVSAAIVGWNDTDMLAGCLESVREFGWPVAYADGPWELACDGLPGMAPLPDVFEFESGDLLLDYPGRPWASEAAKRTALAHFCQSVIDPPEWLLWLDTDERLEAPNGVAAAKDWLEANLEDDHLWATLIIYRPDQEWSDGFPIPRLIRGRTQDSSQVKACRFQPPRDFEAYCGPWRIAYLDGEEIPDVMTGCYLHVPPELLRIRHDKAPRPIAQKERTSRYVKRRQEAHGV